MDEKVGVEITSRGRAATVTFNASSISDLETIARACERIKSFIEENRPRKIIVDFEGVRFFSSQVLGLLLEVRAKLESCEGQVVISGINPRLYRVFKVTHLDRVFQFYPDKESAVETDEYNSGSI